MGVIAIVLIIVFVFLLSWIEIPKMLRGRLHKELILYSIILLFSAVVGILVSVDIKVFNPSDAIASFLSPIVIVVKSILG
ncbi:hypothetical protein [Faecalispora anaeroviscerum]|uniref:hypothetical protein n=1 Tax=Faecalispora anaeroviscerum TaxID=2991836 RepID=UPI0024BA2CAD|nr:hypothetical protein [Faecalispora anaeroviscerum]